MEDIDLLRFSMNRKQFQTTFNMIDEDIFSYDVVSMLKWFKYYFKTYTDDANVNIEKLSTLMKLDKSTDKKTFEITRNILNLLKIPIEPTVRAALLETLETRRLAGELGILLKRFDNNEEIDFSFEILQRAQESYARRKIKHGGAWEDGDVWQMVQEDADNSGYLFDFLPRSFYMQIKGVNEGDNICIGAPTNKGKTSFLVNCAVSFAKQHKELYEKYLKVTQAEDWDEPEDFKPMVWRPVLYLVNEGTARKITPRVYQTALGVDRNKLFELGRAGKLESEYVKILGRRDAIRLVNVHGMTVSEITRVIEQHNPFLVITDMTGRIRVNSGSGSNDVAQLEEVWENLRVQAAIQSFIHIGTIQISAEGFNNYYPPISAAQNSKTGVQTTWDLAIYIGAMLEPAEGQEGVRGISTPKSKMARAGCKDIIQQLTHFNPELNTWRLSNDE